MQPPRQVNRTMVGLAVVLLGIGGCGLGATVPRDQAVVLEPGEGMMVVAVETNLHLNVTFCRDADFIQCVDLPAFTADSPVAISRVPVGRYCLGRITAEVAFGTYGYVEAFSRDSTTCFDVGRAVLSYPGHLVYRDAGDDGLERGWDQRAGFEKTVRRLYPKLGSWRFEVVDTGAP